MSIDTPSEAPAAPPVAPTPPLVQTFMTHRMTDAAILQLCTGREKEISVLRDALERSLQAAPGALQHVVIYGPRGFGKSFMTRLAQIEARKLAGADALIPFVLLPEEQHNLTRNPHALPDYIAQRLADLRTGEDHSWAGSMFQWPDPSADARRWNEAVQRLDAELERSLPGGQGLAVVAIENFDTLLFNVFKDKAAEQRLRKWLDRPNNRLMLIATATGSVDMDYERPLFHAFQPLRLAPWSPDTCLSYFERRRAAEARPPLDDSSRPKARAVADFIGGNPRLAQLLADVLDTHDALSVASIMDALADKLADYYRRRIDDLPSLGQGLLDALIRGGEPASQTELARRVGAGSQADIARTMQELQRSDIVRGTPALDSRETLYRVTDRVFVHFYRVRQGQQQALRTPLATILDFLQAFYSRDEQRGQALRALGERRPAEARLFADLARQGDPGAEGSNGYTYGFIWRWRRAIALADVAAPWTPEALQTALDSAPEQVHLTAQQWQPTGACAQAARAMVEAQALARLAMNREAEAVLTVALQHLNERDAQALLLNERASVRWTRSGGRSGFAEDMKTLSRLNVADAPASVQILTLSAKCEVDADAGLHELLLSAAEAAATLAQRAGDLREQAVFTQFAGWALRHLGRHAEAVHYHQTAADLAERAGDLRVQAVSLGHIAWSMSAIGRDREALQAVHQAAALAHRTGDLWLHAQSLRLAALLLGEIARYEDSVQAAHEAATLAQRAGDVHEQAQCMGQAARSLGSLGRHAEALADGLDAHKLALSIGDYSGLALTAVPALRAAAHLPSRAAVDAYSNWVQAEAHDPASRSRLNAADYVEEWLIAVVRAAAWDAVDALLAGPITPLAAHKWFLGRKLGGALAAVAVADGRAVGFEAVRALLPRLKRLLALGTEVAGRLASTLARVISGFAKDCRDPGLLRDVAGLLTAELYADAPSQGALLLALADLDESPAPAALLARADPDLAIWLRHMRELAEPAARPKAGIRKAKGKNKQS